MANTKLVLRALAALVSLSVLPLSAEPPVGKGWKLVFEEDFSKGRDAVFERWVSANGPEGHILSSRWPENVAVEDGILKLLCKKESRGGQDWTAGSIWTKKHFKYGYYECRYRYADAPGVNNSFWLMTRGYVPPEFTRFELDINEGHFPDEVNVTIHNWSDITTGPDGSKSHPVDHNSFSMGDPAEKPDALVTVPLDAPVSMHKIRITSDHYQHFHIREFAAYPKNSLGGYPSLNDKGWLTGTEGVENFAKSAKVNVSGRFAGWQGKTLDERFKPEYAADGKVSSSWVSPMAGEKWIELEFDSPKQVGCVQFLSGWNNNGEFKDVLPSYKLEYFDGRQWKTLKERSMKDSYSKNSVQLSKSWNTYAMLWNEKEFVFYFNGKEIMRRENKVAHFPAPIFLSAAITHWAHGVTDAVDKTSMDVDYVKVWQTDEDGGGIFEPMKKPK